MGRFRTAVKAAFTLAAIGALLRQKCRAAAVAADTAWITVVVAGVSGKLQSAADWLNSNVGTWSFLLGFAGFAVSAYTKRRMIKAAEEGRLRLGDEASD